MQKFVSLILMVAGFQVIANAQVINFEDITGTNEGNLIEYGDTIVSDGFEFQSQTEVGKPDAIESWTSRESSFYTGSIAPYINYYGDTLLMTKVGGGSFSLTQIDLADLLLEDEPSTITFTGSNNQTDMVTMTNPTELTSYALTNLNDVTSVQFSAGSIRWYQFDNIHYAATPEPTSMAILGFGIFGLMRRRRQG